MRARPMPGTSRRRAPGSRSTICSTSSPCWASSHSAPRGPTCLTEARSALSAWVLAGGPTRVCSTCSWRPKRGCSRHWPATCTVSPSCRWAIGPVSTTSSPSSSIAAITANAPSSARQRTATISAARVEGSGTARGYASGPTDPQKGGVAHGVHGQGEEARRRCATAGQGREAEGARQGDGRAGPGQARRGPRAVQRAPAGRWRAAHAARPADAARRRGADRAGHPGGRRGRAGGRAGGRAHQRRAAGPAGRTALRRRPGRRPHARGAAQGDRRRPAGRLTGPPVTRCGRHAAHNVSRRGGVRQCRPMGLGAILTAIVTPFDDDLNVDEQAFVDLLHHLAAHGSDGFVVCGTTGEASTLTDEEHLRVVELAVQERPEGASIIAGAGSNDTRHAVHLTERATALGVDAVLSVTPYYNKPNRRGIKRHYEEVARATDRPIILYNIPSRVVVDVPNDLLAELAQIEHVEYVKQANNDNLAPVDGLGIYAGNDETLLRALQMGGCGGICVASHLVGDEMRRMVDEPERREEIDAGLRDLYAAMGVTTNPIPVKAALEMAGHPVGGLRLPMVEADEDERAEIRAVLERHGLLASAGTP